MKLVILLWNIYLFLLFFFLGFKKTSINPDIILHIALNILRANITWLEIVARVYNMH